MLLHHRPHHIECFVTVRRADLHIETLEPDLWLPFWSVDAVLGSLDDVLLLCRRQIRGRLVLFWGVQISGLAVS